MAKFQSFDKFLLVLIKNQNSKIIMDTPAHMSTGVPDNSPVQTPTCVADNTPSITPTGFPDYCVITKITCEWLWLHYKRMNRATTA